MALLATPRHTLAEAATPPAAAALIAISSAAVTRAVRCGPAGLPIRGITGAEGLFKQVEKSVKPLLQNPRHPSLQTHEYDSIPNPSDPNAKVFEAYAQNQTPGAYRLFWCYGPNKGEITLIAITPHP